MFSISHLHTLRKAEIDRVAPYFSPQLRILEIGAGTGEQAAELERRGFNVTAIEIENSNYAENRVFPILNYDGRHIPLPDASVDIVYSSNVLEHVPDLRQMHSEIARVLKPGGYCIHVLPTHGWRFWSTISAFLDSYVRLAAMLPNLIPHALPSKAELHRLRHAWYRAACCSADPFLQSRHGERGNLISEHWLFRPDWWRRNFSENGFAVVLDEPMGLFYTGSMVIGSHLSLARRKRMAAFLGSACHLFKLTRTSSNAAAIS